MKRYVEGVNCAAIAFATLLCFFWSKGYAYKDIKISPNGQIVAALSTDGGGARLKTWDLYKSSGNWEELEIPDSTRSFNFSLSCKQFLIAYSEAGGVLAKTTGGLKSKPVEIYRSKYKIAFPWEIESNKYLFQVVTRFSPNKYPIHQWKIYSPGNEVVGVGKEFGPSYSNVNIVKKKGFFIVTDEDVAEKMHAFAFPGGGEPNAKRYVNKDTQDLSCNSTMEVCVRSDRLLDEKGYYFRLFKIDDAGMCEIKGLPRWVPQIKISEEGNAVVIVVADDPKASTELRIFQFANKGCDVFKSKTLPLNF